MSAPLPLPGVESKVLLEVGERRFTTTVDTLVQESALFLDLITRKKEEVQPKLQFFMDLDGDVFAHILQYLRSGVFPVFYDKAKGHDYSLYTMLLHQAHYMEIPRLEQWLKEKTYLQAVTVTRSMTEVELTSPITVKTQMDTDVEYCSHSRTRKVYICPRGIFVHRGQPEKCGRRCNNAVEDSDDMYKDEHYVVVSITRTKIEFNQELCMKGPEVQA